MTTSIAQAIAQKLDTITGLRTFDYVPDAVQPPSAFVGFPAIDYDADMGPGADSVATFPVYVVVTRATEKGALRKLEPYLAGSGSQSVKAKLETDRTLGGKVGTLRVTRATVAPIEIGGSAYIAAAFSVECYYTAYTS